MINTLTTIFDNKVVPNLKAGRVFEFSENDPSAKLKLLKVKFNRGHIVNGSSIINSLFIELDQTKSPFDKITHFFCSHAANVNKACDLVVFVEKEEHIAVLICDLKSSSAGCNDQRAVNQFKNSFHFTEYVVTLATSFFNVQKNIKYYNIAFYPSLGISLPTTLGPVPPQRYIEQSVGVNKELVNMDTNGTAIIQWVTILSKI